MINDKVFPNLIKTYNYSVVLINKKKKTTLYKILLISQYFIFRLFGKQKKINKIPNILC